MKARVAFLGLVLATSTVAQLPNDALVDGKTIPEWSAEWWKWVFSIPPNQNPELDADGSRANNDQPKSVFFLSGVIGYSGIANRAFTAPENKYLFLPLINVWTDNVYTQPPLSIGELRGINSGYINTVTQMHAIVDGVSLTNLFEHRAVSPVFNLEYQTPDNIESYLAGQPVLGLVDPMVSDGYWLMLAPLPPGVHVISFGGTFGPPINFSIDITDTITITAVTLPQQIQDLISLVESTTLSSRQKRRLLENLTFAKRSFERGRTRLGILFLVSFELNIRRNLARNDPAWADELFQAAQRIAEAARTQSEKKGRL